MNQEAAEKRGGPGFGGDQLRLRQVVCLHEADQESGAWGWNES